MSRAVTSPTPARVTPPLWPIYYGWMQVVLAAVAMSATLPGRTQGLGLITEPLLRDLPLDRVAFARLNLAGSLLGAVFALPSGWLIDRVGVRGVLATLSLALGLSVIGMSAIAGPFWLFTSLVLVRGFGQSALSVASMALVGKWFRRRLGTAMGLFALLLTFGFIAGVLAVGTAVERVGWREAWRELGLAVLALPPLFYLFARNSPEACGALPDAPVEPFVAHAEREHSLWHALKSPAFWIVTLGGSLFNLVWSGVTLFNESLLAERGLDRQVSVTVLAILTGAGLLANLAGGALATRGRVLKLLAFGLAFLAVALVLFPAIDGPALAYLYAVALGLSGGLVTVVFFAAYGHLFGRAELGRIQGVAQFATVLASALGPVVMAEGQALAAAYAPVLVALAAISALLACAAAFAPLPDACSGPSETPPGLESMRRSTEK